MAFPASLEDAKQMTKRAVLWLTVASLLVGTMTSCENEPRPTTAVPAITDTISPSPAVTLPPTEQDNLAAALRGLQGAVLQKIDFDIDNTARTFTSVKDYWRHKRWADIIRPSLRAYQSIMDLLSLTQDPDTLAETIGNVLTDAQSAAEILSLVMIVQDVQDAGNQLYYGVNGPTFIWAVEKMLDQADDTIGSLSDFSPDHYTRVIENHLLGVQGQPVVRVARRSTAQDRRAIEFVDGAQRVRLDAKRSFDLLISEVEKENLPREFPTDEMTAQLEYLRTKILESTRHSVGMVYNTRFAGCASQDRVRVTLGAVADRQRVWDLAAENLDARLVIESRVELIKTGNVIATTVGYAVPGSPGIEILQQAFTLGEIIIEPYASTFGMDPEEAFYMLPQEMLLTLPVELSSLWMIVDDTDQYLRCLLEDPSPAITRTRTVRTPTSTPTLVPLPTKTPSPTSSPTLERGSQPQLLYVGEGGIHRVDRDGRNDELLIAKAHHPLWLPDGRIAYVAGEEEIRIADSDGSAEETAWQTPLDSYAGHALLKRIKWSPDGKGFFGQWHWTTGGMPFPWESLTFVDLTTAEEIKLFEESIVGQFDVSLSDGQIVFVELVELASWTEALSVVDRKGKSKNRLLTAKASDSQDRIGEMSGPLIKAPAWSPDGKQIAFYLSDATDPPDRAKLCAIDADGSNLRELRQVWLEPVHSWHWNGDIAWSPDGTEIAYRDQNWIWVINADGSGEPRRLVKGRSPVWALSTLVPTLTPSPAPTPGSTLTPVPATPAPITGVKLVGKFGQETSAVAVQGDYAYIGTGPRLAVLDVSDPAAPTLVGQTEEFPRVVEGHFQASVEDIVIRDSCAYVTVWNQGLWVIDISNPFEPRQVGFCEIQSQAAKVSVSGSYAYVATDHGLSVVDVSDPANPQEVVYYMPENYELAFSDVFVSGRYAYVTDYYAGLTVVDISDPANPRRVGFDASPVGAVGIAVSGSYAYVVTTFECDGGMDYDGLRVYDMTDPTDPQEVGSHAARYIVQANIHVPIAVDGSCVCLAAWQGGLRILDVLDPAHPREVAAYEGLEYANGVALSEPYLYVAGGAQGLFILTTVRASPAVHPTPLPGDTSIRLSSSRLVFYANRSGNDDLYIVNADGSHVEPLTTFPGNDQLPLGPTQDRVGQIQRPVGLAKLPLAVPRKLKEMICPMVGLPHPLDGHVQSPHAQPGDHQAQGKRRQQLDGGIRARAGPVQQHGSTGDRGR